MSKYNYDLDYLTLGCDISNEELIEIIGEADVIIKSHNADPNTLSKAYLKKAQCLQKLGNFWESKESVEFALKFYSEMPEALVRLGNIYNLVEKKYDVAIQYINCALEKKHEYAYGFVMRGNAYLNKGEVDKALMDYYNAIKLKPNYAEAYVNQGGIYLLLGENDKVITNCNEAIQLKPDYAEAYVNRGNAYFNKNDLYNAIFDYNKANQLGPNYFLSFLNRGVAYANIDEIDKAIIDFTEAIKLQPNTIYFINNLGITYGKEGKYDKAIAIFSVIIQLRPDYLDAINNRGITFAKKNDYTNAITDFIKAIQLVPNNAASYFNLGNVYAELGLYDGAISNFSIGLQIQPTDIEALFSRACIYADKLDYTKAITDYTEVIRLKPDYAEAFYNRGSIYDRMREFERAISDFTEALHFGLSDEETFFSRGAAYAAKGDYDLAIEDYERTIQLKPDYINAFYNKGNVFSIKGEHNKAIENYDKAILLQPNHVGALINRGTINEIKKEHDKALDDYSKALLIIIEPKDIYIDLFESKNIEVFYYLVDKILPKKPEIFWELPIDRLQNAPHFFIRIIIKFRNMGLQKAHYKGLIQAVYSFWQDRRNFENGITVYQYTTLDVLEKMRINRRFHLKPASYQNDPQEGQIFYKRLDDHFKIKDSYISDIIESLSKKSSELAVFIRSLTSCKNSLVMWDSSYCDNGKGVSVGISAWKINKGQGINIERALNDYTPVIRIKKTLENFDFNKTRNTKSALQNVEFISKNIIEKNENAAEFVPLWRIGLYKILYVDNNTQEVFKDIINCLSQFEKTEFSKEFKELLGELFSSITHLIKDKAYAHEEEYRLLFVDSIIKDKKYIKTAVENSICKGIYVETEPVLFQDDKDIVFFGPKVPEITIDKYRHAFRLSGLPFVGSADEMLKSSGIYYR